MRFRAQPALAVGLVLVVLVGAAGYGTYLASTKDAPATGGSVREGLVVDGPLSLVPPFATTQNARDVSSLLFRGLTRIGPDGQALPELATSWDVSQAKTFTFHLRPNLVWSDGEPIRPSDAIFTLSVLQSEAVANTPAGQEWTGVKLTAPDASTLVYTLPAPNGAFLDQAAFGIIPQHALRNMPAQAMAEDTDIPTSGPYKVDNVQRDTLTLRRNDRSFEHAFLDTIQFRLFGAENVAVDALAADDIDILAGLTPGDADRLKRAPNRRVAAVKSYQYAQLLFNQKVQPVLQDVKIRQAMAAAIDRKRLIDGTLRGWAIRAASPIPPGITWAASTDPGQGYDPAAAGRLLDGAGWRLGKSGIRQKDGHDFVLTLVTLDIDLYKALAEDIQAQLKAIGLGINVMTYPEERLYGSVLQDRNFDLALTLVDNGPDPDFYVFWHSSQSQQGGFNFSGMAKDVFLDKDLEDGRATTDLKARKDAYADAQKILRDDVAAVFLFSPDLLIGVATRIHGFDLNPAIETTQRYEYVQNWYVGTHRVRR